MPADALITIKKAILHAGERCLLQELDLVIRGGGPSLLLGPNGAGKTSLLKLMMGLLQPTSGEVQRVNARCAFLFQKPIMLRRTAEANIAFAREAAGLAASQDKINALLADVGLLHLRKHPARKLSGGEQQRLALARALAGEPQILFLDEPTASLDVAQTKLVEELITRVASRGVKIIMSSHDLGQARRLAQDVLFLVNGQLQEQGPAQAFFTHPRTENARRFLCGELVLV
jgi:tungstate transport system ATP-binding protein